MGFGSRPLDTAQPLGELQDNQQSHRSPAKMNTASRERSKSPTKKAFNLGLKTKSAKSEDSSSKTQNPSPKKPKKTKSSTNLAALLTRPKSLRNLRKQDSNDDVFAVDDKENRTPGGSLDESPPIWAQFSSDAATQQPVTAPSSPAKTRPVSHNLVDLRTDTSNRSSPHPVSTQLPGHGQDISGKPLRHHVRSKSAAASPAALAAELAIDPKDIDKHLEALLDRRNIPENQRYKMRNLADTIKMEFIRQDWAEMQAVKRDGSLQQRNCQSSPGNETDTAPEEKQGRSRGRSFTFSRGRKDSRSSSKPGKREGSIGRHLRSKSTENFSTDKSTSSGSNFVSGMFSNMKPQQGPVDYVSYLRKVQKPELVEVGKIHKLRLLLRNETVSWIEHFIERGGMEEIVRLLNRIMEVEWREEHEDALLHENLLCLKALSTTALAITYLDNVREDLFPKLLHLIFDPEKKGPSEFTTRNIITSILLNYISSASPAERVIRAKSVLAYLRDPEPKEEKQPLPFLMNIHQERPYRVWCKEAVSVTKEVFWIFLHNLNVISLPSAKGEEEAFFPTTSNPSYSYMMRHFPHERPPVPAAPYVGGVEWDATNYLASHLDLMNAIIACTATQDGRNHIRAQLRISGWERCMGTSLRLCKEKFYGSVHEALRTWVAAAAEDEWNVVDVRFGPPREDNSRNVSPKKAQKEDLPQLAMPKFDLGF